ncbi:uncharacterized protein LOC123528985 [Mercenaria mercenaria]|uniref:uncharacterized protein LOC123528985 n=1 Tax=Mercenaria mercenaria TaxID=6596 RepID=UPI00234ECCBC|nr:uncharacterized protein LOC123528985 [Mercenaria mercenaria]
MAYSTEQFVRHKPFLSKDKLDEYWRQLSGRIMFKAEEEIVNFCHCTGIKARREIINDGVIYGSETDTPSSAPLASNEELRGTWFSLATNDLPRKSPYGSQRMKIRAEDFMACLLKNELKLNTNDTVNGTDESKMPEDSEVTKEPLLFFECAHRYGNRRYARLLLVRASDPMITWCKNTCKEISLRDNPVLEYRDGRIWSRAHGQRMGVWSRSHGQCIDVTVEVLVVGDIYLDQVSHGLEWDKVKKSMRAGGDPILGL